MNLLSIAATCGILVAVFEWGWGGSIIGVAKQPIAPFLPMMLFAILFGLSMDYEVFLLSRVNEEHDRTHNSGLAVANGLNATARVITAAAAIMVTVFFSFLFQPDPLVKLFGRGLGMAILIDATVVRMVLVPATMELLGEANWWMPRWLDATVPQPTVDGEQAVATIGSRENEAVAGTQVVDMGEIVACDRGGHPCASLAAELDNRPANGTGSADDDCGRTLLQGTGLDNQQGLSAR